MIIHIDRSGDVHGGDEAEAIVNTTFANDALDFIGDVDHLIALASVHFKIAGVGAPTTGAGADRGLLAHVLYSVKMFSCV
jgi:hypothetical protein